MRAHSDSPRPCIRTVSDLFRCVDSAQFPSELVRSLRALAPLDRVYVYAVRRDATPWILYGNETEADAGAVQAARAHREGGYRVDPYYRAFIDGIQAGFYSGADAGASSRWERVQHAAYLSPVSERECLVALLVRTAGSRVFSAAELASLRSIEEAVVAALRLHWTTCAERNAAAHAGTGDRLHHDVDAAIDVFGEGELTPREGQVVRSLLRGFSTKAVAVSLGIAVATAALHRKRAYAKLGVSSQAELFYRFLCSLAHPAPTLESVPRRKPRVHSDAARDQVVWPLAASGAS